MKNSVRRWIVVVAAAAVVSAAVPAVAQTPPVNGDTATRYLALGDSLPAGYKVLPVTNAYPYVLYETGAFDIVPNMLFANAAVPGATSSDLLLHQVPQATIGAADGGFLPAYITVTIGGNDLLSILHFLQTHPNPNDVLQFAGTVLSQYGANLFMSLAQLHAALPNAKIYVANQYALPRIEALVPLAAPLIAAFNSTVQQVVSAFPNSAYLVDVHSAFVGGHDLLLADRPGGSLFETHVTGVGQRVMAQTFADAIAASR